MSVLAYGKAKIDVQISNAALARAIETQLRASIAAFETPPDYPMIRLRTFRRLETIDVAGRLVVVRVTERGVRRLPALVEAIRGKGALGVQIVWDGADRERFEATVFRILETARATKSGPPVVLSASTTPSLALRHLVFARSKP